MLTKSKTCWKMKKQEKNIEKHKKISNTRINIQNIKKLWMKTLPQRKNMKNITITQTKYEKPEKYEKHKIWVGVGGWGNPSYTGCTGCTGCTHWKPYNAWPDRLPLLLARFPSWQMNLPSLTFQIDEIWLTGIEALQFWGLTFQTQRMQIVNDALVIVLINSSNF